MLVLTRKVNEGISIFIGDKRVLRFGISQINNKCARIVFKAEENVVIMRDEIIDKPKKNVDESEK